MDRRSGVLAVCIVTLLIGTGFGNAVYGNNDDGGRSDDPEVGLRLTVQPPRQFSLVLDREGVGDHVVEHEGSKVLLVEQESAALLEELTIDVKDTHEGTKLVISKEPP